MTWTVLLEQSLNFVDFCANDLLDLLSFSEGYESGHGADAEFLGKVLHAQCSCVSVTTVSYRGGTRSRRIQSMLYGG